MCDSEESGSSSTVLTGSTVGELNSVGEFNSVSGGVAVEVFTPNTLSRRPWLSQNARFNDLLLDASYPNIALQWFVEITLDTDIVFRLSDKAFYVQDEDGASRYYDARIENAPTINVSVGEWLNPNYQISDLTLQINNRDGYFNQYLPHGDEFRQWSNASVVVKVGFGEFNYNYMTLFEGQVTEKQGISTTRDSISLHVYDKLAQDAVPIPANTFTTSIYPDVNTADAGKPIPLVYGDWTENVPDSGTVTAYCTNANEANATSFEFKISDFPLQSIDSIWLHRGRRKEGEPEGPIEIDINEVTLNLAEGSFSIDVSDDVFTSETVLYDNQTAGSGSGFEDIAAKDTSINFITQRIQVGDRVLKRKTGDYADITVVANTALTLGSSGVTFADGDEYLVLTSKYQFLPGDRISVTCVGKPLNLVSVADLPDEVTESFGLSVGADSTYWLCDDTDQKVYNISFDNEIIQEIPYTDIEASITSLSGVSVATGGFIWVADPDASTIYKYNYTDLELVTTLATDDITGIGTPLTGLSGITVRSSANVWIVDKATGDFYEVNTLTSAVVTTFSNTAFDALATDILSIGYDATEDQLTVVDRDTNSFYRVSVTDGTLINAIPLTNLHADVDYVTGVCVAADGTIFFVDRTTASIYNYTDSLYALYNPCFIAKDILMTFGDHTYDEFDLSWNETAAELVDYKCRAVIKSPTTAAAYVNSILKQYNVVFHQRFNKFALFRLTYGNFITTGKDVKEKDIKMGTFQPTKELNQYFNSASANYGTRDFQGSSLRSDTYLSAAGVDFNGKEVNKTLELGNVYVRADLDRLMPLFVSLAVPDPEFINVTLGFRHMRVQIQDFLNVTFDGEPNLETGIKMSGRRFDNVPCMVRSISYNLGTMSVGMKLWSLGGTAFPDYTPPGTSVGGYLDPITLTNLGRLGRISPVGVITGSTTDTLTIADVDGDDAETRTGDVSGLAWKVGHKVDLINGSTKAVVETLTIESVSGGVIAFVETFAGAVTNTTVNTAGFITSGHYIQYAAYSDTTETQQDSFASFCNPTADYPATQALEVSEQRAGDHSFSDESLPYLLWPRDFSSV